MSKKPDWQIRTELSNGVDISTVEFDPRYVTGPTYETCVFYPNNRSEVVWCGFDKNKAIKNHMDIVKHEALHQLAQENPTDFPQAFYGIG